MWPISTRVNKPENDDPSMVEPIAPPRRIFEGRRTSVTKSRIGARFIMKGGPAHAGPLEGPFRDFFARLI